MFVALSIIKNNISFFPLLLSFPSFLPLSSSSCPCDPCGYWLRYGVPWCPVHMNSSRYQEFNTAASRPVTLLCQISHLMFCAFDCLPEYILLTYNVHSVWSTSECFHVLRIYAKVHLHTVYTTIFLQYTGSIFMFH
jgi:hypothetical protein